MKIKINGTEYESMASYLMFTLSREYRSTLTEEDKEFLGKEEPEKGYEHPDYDLFSVSEDDEWEQIILDAYSE